VISFTKIIFRPFREHIPSFMFNTFPGNVFVHDMDVIYLPVKIFLVVKTDAIDNFLDVGHWRDIYIDIMFLILLLIVVFFMFREDRVPRDHTTHIKILVRQASRWAIAAAQDNNAGIAVLHANYGAGYLLAMMDLYTPSQVEDATGIRFMEFKKLILDIQDKASMQLIRECPSLANGQHQLVELSKGLFPEMNRC